jgi:hypothetical protein
MECRAESVLPAMRCEGPPYRALLGEEGDRHMNPTKINFLRQHSTVQSVCGATQTDGSRLYGQVTPLSCNKAEKNVNILPVQVVSEG